MDTKKYIRSTQFVIIALLIFFSLMSACNPEGSKINITETPTQAPTTPPAPTQTPTQRNTSTPTAPPLGSPGNPIRFAFLLKSEAPTSIEAAEDIVFLLSEQTGLSIESAFYPDFQSLSTAVLNAEIHLFWLQPLEYLYLRDLGAAEVLLMTNHLGVYAYGVQFLANTYRGFSVYFDPQTNQGLGNPIDALQQFSGTRPCFTNPQSLPGYYVPLGLLNAASTPTLEPVFTYGYSATIRALYIRGICDFGVSYALTGDARSASDILTDLPDARDVVAIIWQSEGIIPNLNLSASPLLPLDMQYKVQESMINLTNSDQGLPLINTALDYEVEALKSVNDSFYNDFRSIILPLGLDLQAITR